MVEIGLGKNGGRCEKSNLVIPLRLLETLEKVVFVGQMCNGRHDCLDDPVD